MPTSLTSAAPALLSARARNRVRLCAFDVHPLEYQRRLVLLRVDSHQAGPARVGANRLVAAPLLAVRHPFDDRQINLFHLATLEQLAVERHRTGALDEKEHACRFRIDPVNEAQKFE